MSGPAKKSSRPLVSFSELFWGLVSKQTSKKNCRTGTRIRCVLVEIFLDFGSESILERQKQPFQSSRMQETYRTLAESNAPRALCGLAS